MKPSDFREGQSVRHRSHNRRVGWKVRDGTVLGVDHEGVHIAYDGGVGIYDDNWFRICEPQGTTLRPR
jgi:hypothetical protein